MIYIKDNNPHELLTKIYNAIDDGLITTWTYDEKKNFFWHPTTESWLLNAYFRPQIVDNGDGEWLRFSLITLEDKAIRQEDFAAYHAHFAQMIIAHFYQDAQSVGLSTMPIVGKDKISYVTEI